MTPSAVGSVACAPAQAPIRAQHGPPIDAVLRGVVVRPGCKVEFDVTTNPPEQRGAVIEELNASVTRPLIDLLKENEADVPLLGDFLQAPGSGKPRPPGAPRRQSIDLPPVPPPPPFLKPPPLPIPKPPGGGGGL